MASERRPSDLRQLVSGLYTLGETIGTGHYAVVKLARHVFTQREVAVKVIDKTKLDEISKAHLFQEVMCMKLVQHPNVVRLYEVIDTPNKLYLILEFADGGDMYDYIMKHANGLNESLARRYFQQICRALMYCHQMHVCHRDLKPENLVFFEKQGAVKLTDFGFSNQFLPGKKLLTSCGSLAYSAPEILLGDPYDAPAVDIWSLGVILFMLVTGRAPFQEANDSETVMMILDCRYKLPPNVSAECENLIHRMIVRDPEKRAKLEDVMSDVWYRKSDGEEDDDYDDDNYTDLIKSMPKDDHESILHQMIDGNIAEQEAILKALNENQYNHITATYYLLAEKLLHDNQKRTMKQKRRVLQPASDPFTEQIGVFIFSSSNFNFADVSLPITRRNSTEELDNVSGKENILPTSSTPKNSMDTSNEQPLSALVEDGEERPPLQQRTTNTTTQPVVVTQAMKIILEEDEYPESPPPPDKTGTNIPPLGNHLKLNKIVESEDEDEQSTTSNTAILPENSTTTSGILRSKDLRSVVETKRRNFSRSCSSSDSEDNGSNHDMNRVFNRKHTRSPSSLHETESLISNRGRSFSNVEHVLNETPSNVPQQLISSNNTEAAKRRSFSSRTSSIVSSNRLLLSNANDETQGDTPGASSLTLINERARSLSIEHRLANPSQMSIGSRTSIRYSTPRESTVFTKNDAPDVVRLLQQRHHHQDTTEMIKALIEHQRLQSATHPDNIQTAIIVEEDISPPFLSTSTTNIRSSFARKMNNSITKSNVIVPTIDNISIGNGHMASKSVLSTLKSLTKQRNSSDIKDKKHLRRKHRTCCTIL